MSGPRYSVLPVDLLGQLRSAGLEPGGDVLAAYVGLLTNPARRTIAGLVSGLGEAGFAESCWLTARAAKKALRALEGAGMVITDWNTRAVFAVGAVLLDPPVTPNATIATARQLAELAPSPVKQTVRSEVEAALRRQKAARAEGKKLLIDVLLEELTELGAATTLSEGPSSEASNAASNELLEGASRARASSDPYPYTDPNPAATAAFRRAWGRLPDTFAAAAAEDFKEALRTLDVETFAQLAAELRRSKWVSGRMNTPPTLRRLVSDRAYVDRVIRGEFRDTALRSDCPDCQLDHALTAECPPVCRACNRPHTPGYQCSYLRNLEDRERAERDDAALDAWVGPNGETFAQLRQTHGSFLAAMHAKLRLDSQKAAAQ